MGDKIKTIKVTFPEDGFIASPGLKKNKKAFDLLRETFAGRSMDVDVSKVSDEEIKEFYKPKDSGIDPIIVGDISHPSRPWKDIMRDIRDKQLSDIYEQDVEDEKRDTTEDIKNSKKFCIDFDGTCVAEIFPNVGPDVPGAAETLRELVDKGHRLILWTARSGHTLDAAIAWFRDHSIPLYAVNKDPHPLEGWPIPRKVIPAWYIDDRNLGTPMTFMNYDGESYEVVDWKKIRDILVNKGIL